LASRNIQKENSNLVNALQDAEDKQRQCDALEAELKKAEASYEEAR
jgi:hypothetical protein